MEPYWADFGGAFGGEFDIIMEEWTEFVIDIKKAVDGLNNASGKPWEYFIPETLTGFRIGLNPVWEPATSKEIYVDNVQVIDLSNFVAQSPQDEPISQTLTNSTEFSFGLPSMRDLVPVGILVGGVIGIIVIFKFRFRRKSLVYID
ncbi:MAG: hypothetical protein ACW99A_15195 [Candidatus Kariarchaeaceae archaeon]